MRVKAGGKVSRRSARFSSYLLTTMESEYVRFFTAKHDHSWLDHPLTSPLLSCPCRRGRPVGPVASRYCDRPSPARYGKDLADARLARDGMAMPSPSPTCVNEV